MLTKEELVKTYIKYSSDITEEIFNKIIDKLESLGFKKYSTGSRNKEYIHFINTFPQLKIYNNYWFVTSINGNYKEIQVSDILGKESHFEVGKWYKHKETTTLYLNPSRNEVIWGSGKFEKNYKSNEDINDWLLLTDLSEIQQYLSDGHVDKLPKTLTANDLVKGEVYKCIFPKTPNWNSLFDSNGKNNVKSHRIYINNNSNRVENFESTIGNWSNDYEHYFELPSKQELKWWKVCIKQDKFIPQSELDKYDEEGNLIETKSIFEFNKWYKRVESKYSKVLIFVYENGYYENGYYGFNLDGKWFNSSHFDYSEFDKERLIPATIEEVKERLLSYAKEKYPIGTKFKCIAYDKEFTVTNPNYMDNASGFTPNDDSTIWIGVKEQCSGRIFGDKGKWAEVISKPESKVNRNVYYEVSNQEEYEEILDWLKSMGEEVCLGSTVTKVWKYICKSSAWYLNMVKPDLPKAEFPFKSKQSIKVNTYFEEACPFPSFGEFSVDLSDVTISEQVICPTIKETPTNEKEIISKIKKSIEF